ncbi:type I-E CRISPR-associated protein Cse1/CasA [Streptomyces pinistramenti]|uniref:type I-E CRISPR-associated protein Cse1/CasA n=1 Tax=Streptomyces pinistramenti TaxID=2884812 RepID=UPI001D061BE5|nr:type I-E CRISPR-associated protein Cse1/CasA [Streptomyces pinistramenti]MCB5911515.1 type I-E CRISPR-associated protein Cse1/CasA [Streptomyces pinistramenti]
MFNLLDEPWLQASPLGEAEQPDAQDAGAPLEVGLRRLIMDADRFRDLVVDLPTQKPALFRQLLLPLVVDALGSPRDATEWTRMFRAGAFTEKQREKLAAYLDAHHHLFGLFDPVAPFAQVSGLRTAKDETKGSALLVATAATGNNVPLFSSRTEGDPLELTPAQAARWLLHTHCWDTAAIKTGVVGDPRAKSGKTTGNPVGPLGQLGVTMPIGRTLYETLLLNIPYGRVPLSDDLPQWRRRALDGRVEETLSCATPAWQSRPARGLLDIWTWQSRRMRLLPEEGPAGVHVTRVVVAAGDRLDLSPDVEPHTAWVIERPSARAAKSARGAPAPAVRPRRHQPGRAAWRGLGALLAVNSADRKREATATRNGFQSSVVIGRLSEMCRQLPQAYPLQVELTGIAYGNQSAVIEDVYFDEIPLPVTALDPEGIVYGALLEAVDQAESLAAAVNHLSGDLRRAAGTEPIPWDKGQRPGDTLLHTLDPVVRRLLAGLRAAGDDFELSERGLEAWERKAEQATWRVAEQVFSAAAPPLFTGRRVVKDGKEHVYRLNTAERAFRGRLDAVLHRRAAARRTS